MLFFKMLTAEYTEKWSCCFWNVRKSSMNDKSKQSWRLKYTFWCPWYPLLFVGVDIDVIYVCSHWKAYLNLYQLRQGALGPAPSNYPDKLQCLLMCNPWITQAILHFNLYIEIFDYGISNFLSAKFWSFRSRHVNFSHRSEPPSSMLFMNLLVTLKHPNDLWCW